MWIFVTNIRYDMTDCTYSKSILETIWKFYDSNNLKMLQFENISVYLKMLQTIFLFNLKSNMFGCCSNLSERGILGRFFGNKYKSPWYFNVWIYEESESLSLLKCHFSFGPQSSYMALIHVLCPHEHHLTELMMFSFQSQI